MNKKVVRVITAFLALVMIAMVAVPSLTTAFADIDAEMSYLAGQYQDLQNAHKQLVEEIKATNDKNTDKKAQR